MALTPGDSGPPGESGSLQPGSVTSRDTILVQSDGSVVDAATITATDGIYGITFSFTLPKTDWRAQIIKVSASNYASYIQQIAQHDHVTAIWYAPDTNAQGLLIDTLVVQVSTDTSNAETEIPFSKLNTPGAFAQVDGAYDTLTKIEAIT